MKLIQQIQELKVLSYTHFTNPNPQTQRAFNTNQQQKKKPKYQTIHNTSIQQWRRLSLLNIRVRTHSALLYTRKQCMQIDDDGAENQEKKKRELEK